MSPLPAVRPSTRPAPNASLPMLALLAAVFLLPVLLGNALFWLDWRPQSFGNHGELLQPTRTLPETGLLHPDGLALPTAQLHGKWLLVIPVQRSCDADCQSRLQLLRQVHIALNKDQDRVQRVLLIGGEIAPDDGPTGLAGIQRKFPDLVVASIALNSAAASWERALAGDGPSIYLVDPMSNVMMRYADPVDMRGVLKDLERLLKYSWIR